MKPCERKLADTYHTTTKPENEIDFSGSWKVVGMDFRESEVDCRFLWFVVKNKKNCGSVLVGRTFTSFRAKALHEIREDAIKAAAQKVGDVQKATKQINAVIKAGGMIFPKKKD